MKIAAQARGFTPHSPIVGRAEQGRDLDSAVDVYESQDGG